MRAVDSGNYDAALNSFQRALDLDKKFVAAYAGLGLANAHLGNTKVAKKILARQLGKVIRIRIYWPYVPVPGSLCGRMRKSGSNKRPTYWIKH